MNASTVFIDRTMPVLTERLYTGTPNQAARSQ